MLQTISVIVKGKVQGVNFRAATKRKSEELGLKGEVSNLPNGEVKIIATGNEAPLDELVAWCWKGPPSAFVQDVIRTIVPVLQFEKFSIVR